MKSKSVKITIVVIVILVVVISSCVSSFNDHQYEVMITEKYRVNDGDNSKYLVLGTDESGNVLVFENTDNILRGKFDSSNVQGQLTEGGTFRLTVVGYRIPLFSWYENIIKIDEIK